MNTTFFYRNRWKETGTTVTASGAVSAYPAANTKTPQPSEVWRSTTLTPYVQADFGRDRRVGGVAVYGHNLTPGSATVRVRVANDAAITDVVSGGDSGHVPAWAAMFPVGSPFADASGYPNAQGKKLLPKAVWAYIFAPEVVGRFVRVDFSDPPNPKGFVEAAYVYAGVVYQPERMMSYGWKLAPHEQAIIKAAQSGQEYTESQWTRWRATARFGAQDEAAANFWMFLFSQLGFSGEMVVRLRDDQALWTAETTMLCRFARNPVLEHQATVGDQVGIYQTTVELEEVIG